MSLNSNVSSSPMGKLSINLLQPELMPEKVLLTLTRVVILWSLVFLAMLVWIIVTNYEHNNLKDELQIANNQNVKYESQITELTEKLTSRKVDKKLEEKLKTIKLLMKNKQALHATLTNPTKTYVRGFALAMDDLATLHHKDIRLESININNDNMTFSGLAFTPEAVPAWLAGFENSVLLSGKSFSHFKLSENLDNITEFTVSSKNLKVTNDE